MEEPQWLQLIPHLGEARGERPNNPTISCLGRPIDASQQRGTGYPVHRDDRHMTSHSLGEPVRVVRQNRDGAGQSGEVAGRLELAKRGVTYSPVHVLARECYDT